MNHNMFPSSTSSSSQSSMAAAGGGGGLMRYASAPSSIISNAVDSVIGNRHHHFLFPSSEAESVASATPNLNDPYSAHKNGENHKAEANSKNSANAHEMRGSGSGYGFPIGGSSSPSLVRHTSSPAQFLNHLAASASASRGGDIGFSITSGVGNYNSKGLSDNGRGITRLNSQLSFTQKEFLSRISEENEGIGDGVGTENNNNNNNQRKAAHSFGSSSGFGTGSWDENNQITFSAPSNKQAKTIGGNIVNGLDTMEPHQFQFSMSHVPIDMPMDKLLHVPQDSVPCKTRANRGCATHPRSIAERERRTRISGKLKKLHDLVPNMDKQTSYADMLDLALQHIKSLQDQVEKLNKELDVCACGCKTMKDS